MDTQNVEKGNTFSFNSHSLSPSRVIQIDRIFHLGLFIVQEPQTTEKASVMTLDM